MYLTIDSDLISALATGDPDPPNIDPREYININELKESLDRFLSDSIFHRYLKQATMKLNNSFLVLLGSSLARLISSAALEVPSTGPTIPAGNSTNSLPNCSQQPRTHIETMDCRLAIIEFTNKFPITQSWQWIHHHEEPPGRYLVVAPFEHSLGTCKLIIDFDGRELSLGTKYQPFYLAGVADHVVDQCLHKNKKEGGRGYVRVEDVKFTVYVEYSGDTSGDAGKSSMDGNLFVPVG